MKCSTIRESFFFSLKFIVFIALFILVFAVLSFNELPKEPSPCLEELNFFTYSDFKKGTFIIDPGHGGEDSGALSLAGDMEKDFCLQYSKLLGEYLKSLGFDVIYTRESDILLESPGAPTKKSGDVKARVKIAKDNPEAVFISIHMNYFPMPQYSGLQVFYSENDYRSELLANRIQEKICLDLQPANNRSPKLSENIFVLDRINTPAVLIECGFLSNERELMLLKSEDYKKQMCFVIAHALEPAYFEFLN